MSNQDSMIRYRKLIDSYKKASTVRECFYHKKETCIGDIKQSHSIQKNGRLSIIEGDVNGNRSLYTFTSNIPSEERFFDDLKPIGKKEASTFFGFCDHHDTMLFNTVENSPFDNSDKHNFLHSYRSFAHSHHKKIEDHKIYNDSNSDFIKSLPISLVRNMQTGINMALVDSSLRKSQLDHSIENSIYDHLEYFVFEKQGLFPFAVSSQMSPKVSYRNKPMNNHIDPTTPYSQPIITFLPDLTTTFVIIAAFPDDEPAINLLDELDALSTFKLERAITSLIIANCENTFFSPLFWNVLTKHEKRRLLNELEVHLPDNPSYHKKFFHSTFNFFDSRFENSNLLNNRSTTIPATK